MARVLIHHHLGLGDHFICNGLVHHMVDRHDVVYLPAKRQYLNAVRCLYSEQPKVEVFPVDDEPRDVVAFGKERGCAILRIGFERCDRDLFDASFYRQLDVPFEIRYSRFELPRVIPNEDELYERLAPGGDYCLVHREWSHGIFGLKIRSALPIVYVERAADPFNNILAFRRLIRGAREIHCINSSVIHLVDGIAPEGRLFYHQVRRTDFVLRPRWNIVPYTARPVLRTLRIAAARARLIRARARAAPART